MTETGTPKPKKQSLKDIARRVSTIPPVPDGQAKARPRTPLDSMRPVAVSAPPPPPAERMNELAELCEATAERVRAKTAPQAVAPTPKRKSTLSAALPIVSGLVVGLGAIALSVVVITRTNDGAAPAAQVVGAQPTVVANAPVETIEPSDKASEAKSPEQEVEPEVEVPPATETEHKQPVKPAAVATGSSGKTESKTDDKSPTDDGATEPTDEEPKGLAGAMADAVGNSENPTSKDPKDDKDVPAVGSAPTTPSQGQVQSALASVRGAARGCVAGMEAPSRASVTFGSDGRVVGVSVSGAASGKPAASCIRSALSSARVPPFTKSSFTVGLSLRP